MANFQQQVNAVDQNLNRLRCYRDPQRVRQDVLNLLRQTPSLIPGSGQLARGGTGTTLLYLGGTLPIFYKGAQYNIPVQMWVTEGYPFQPATVFVTPTADMIIKPGHRHVDSQGMCYHPYMAQWNASTCNLTGIAMNLAQVFGEDPPVRQKAQQPPQRSPAQSSPYPTFTSSPNPEQELKNRLTQKIQAKLNEFYRATTKEIDDMMAGSNSAASLQQAQAKEKQQLQQQKAVLGEELDQLENALTEITQWLSANSGNEDMDIDAITEPKEPLNKQLLYMVTADATIEDLFYYLDKALNNGHIGLDEYLKQIRKYSREQFLNRATIKKIHEQQRR